MKLSRSKNAYFVSRLLTWFEKNHREYPWRRSFKTPDPYRILFTELMLQRTRADQVVPIYEKFFSRFPTFGELQRNPKEAYRIFALLGLRWRAKKIVQLIGVLKRNRGIVPSSIEELRNLPGVGEYVAGAVMCYAFKAPEAPIDTNVIRILSRFFGLATTDSSRRDRKLLSFARSLVPPDRAHDFNLSLLDFGALVCKTKPLCGICPLSSKCSYFLRNSVSGV